LESVAERRQSLNQTALREALLLYGCHEKKTVRVGRHNSHPSLSHTAKTAGVPPAQGTFCVPRPGLTESWLALSLLDHSASDILVDLQAGPARERLAMASGP